MENPCIDSGHSFDWSRASAWYGRWRDIYPPQLFQRLAALGIGTSGQQVLDLGTGTGALPRGMAGYGAYFTGIDIAPGQIAEARRLAQQEGASIEFLTGAAEEMDFAAGRFHAATACQCFLYFNTRRLLPRLHHALKPGGTLCVVWMAWLPGESPVAAASEALVLGTSPAWTGGGYTRQGCPEEPAWAPPLFCTAHREAFLAELPFTRESWHGRMMACRGVAATLEGEALARFNETHRQMLMAYPERFTIPHEVTITTVRAV